MTDSAPGTPPPPTRGDASPDLMTRAGRAWRRTAARIRPVLGSAAARLRPAVAGLRARLGPRGSVVVAGIGTLTVVGLLAIALGGGAPVTPGQSPSPSGAGGATASGAPGSSGPDIDPFAVLPGPSSTDTVLLVADASSLTSHEQQWLNDLRGAMGKVDPLAYRDASVEELGTYLVIFVIDKSNDLDPGVLTAMYRAGRSVHLVGAASTYDPVIKAGVTPRPAATSVTPAATPGATP